MHITDVTEEEIDEILGDIGMKKGHKRTFKREWAKLKCAAYAPVSSTNTSASAMPVEANDSDDYLEALEASQGSSVLVDDAAYASGLAESLSPS